MPFGAPEPAVTTIKNWFAAPQRPNVAPSTVPSSAGGNLLGALEKDVFALLEKELAPLAKMLGIDLKELAAPRSASKDLGFTTQPTADNPSTDPDVLHRDEILRESNYFGSDPGTLVETLDAAQRELNRATVGGAWKALGPTKMTSDEGAPKLNSGRPNSIVVDPKDPNTVYLGSADGGVWKTTDHGKSWSPITENAPSQTIGALSMDPTNNQTLYAGFGEDFSNQMPGLMKTTDGGKTWSAPVVLSGTYAGQTKPVTATQTRDIKVSPDDPNVVLAATNVGVFRSTDGGQTFALTPMPPGANSGVQSAWSIGRTGPHTWVCTTQDEVKEAGVGHVWRSTDDGQTWQEVSMGSANGTIGRMTVAVADSTVGTANTRVYILAAADDGGSQADVFKSTDGGQTFAGLGVNANGTPVNPTGDSPDLNIMHDQAWYNQMIAVDPKNPDNVIIGGNLSTARTNDGGKTWAIESSWTGGEGTDAYVHADAHAAAIYSDGTGTHVLVGSDGGIFASDGAVFSGAPMGAKWDDSMNAGLQDLLARSLATDWKNQIVSGLQDNGTITGTAGGPSAETNGGDGWGVAESSNPNIIMGSVNGQHMRSTDGGKTWMNAENGLPGSSAPFDVRYSVLPGDKNGKSFLTIAQDSSSTATNPSAGVYKTTDGGASWKKVVGTVHTADGKTTTTIPGTIRSIEANPKNANMWAVATGDGHVYTTVDGGKNYQESVKLGVPDPIYPAANNIKLNGISFDSSDPSGKTYFVSQGGRGAPGTESAYMFKTTDGGKTFTPVNTGSGDNQLPDVPVNVIRQDPSNPQTLYVATVLGVYRTQDGGASWSRLGQGLPMVSVTDLQISPDGQRLRVATYGRGFFELNLAGA